MRYIKVLIANMSLVCQERQAAVLRILVVLCLYSALVSHFYPLSMGSAPIPEQMQAEIGVGGGVQPEKGILEEQLENSWILETGELEPESFSKPRMLLYSSYSIEQGDIIGTLAERFGLNQDTLISINSIKNTRLIQVGQVLRVPNQDGIMYTVKRGDTLEAIAKKYESEAESIQMANELFSESAQPGTVLFIPGARLDWMERQEINGDLFIWPVSGRITSPYGWRRSPFTDARQFHGAIDIGAGMGSPVRAAMSGRVSSAGWDNILGNYVVISHHSGYRTLYGHLSSIRTRSGAYVGTGERIGDVGSTGLSTGPHLHFTVYKNGVTVNPRSLLK